MKKKKKVLEIKNITDLDALTKLRIVVASIFVLSTVSLIILILASAAFAAAVLLFISYLFVFILMVKLFTIESL
jgi:hypothetical protein